MSTRAEFFQSMYPGLSNGEVIDELIKASIYGFEQGPEVVTISAAEGIHYVPYDVEMLIRSRLPDPVGGFVFDRRGTPASPLPPQFTT